MEITKPNDIFSALVQKPDLNLFDLASSNVVPSNTQLLPMDDYKKLDKVQSMFKDASGKFDDKTFNAAYQKAASLYNDLGNDKALAKALEYDPTDFTAPKGALRADVAPVITKDYNPFKQLYSRTGINSIDVSDLSLRELAQQSKVYDSESKQWLDKSANDMGLMGSLVGPTMVYAQWDEDGADIDPMTKRHVNHKKGDWKYDKDGNLYIETLGKREVYGKQIVNPMDLITVDGSKLNKVDFFDSDGKDKSVFGTTMKLATQVAPYLIPGVNVYYGGMKMALGLATVLPTFYKAAEALFTGDTEKGNETSLWKAMNTAQGYLSKYDVRSISDAGSQSMWNYEQMGSMVADTFSQIYEQRAAGSLSNLFYKSHETEYLAKLANQTEDILQDVAIGDAVKGITRSKENYERLAQVAYDKIGTLESINHKRSQLAETLNLGYMAMTQSADVYGDAKAGGYDNRTAGFAALLAASGQYALMKNNNLGHWFLDKSTGYTEEVNKAGIRSVTRELMGETQEAVNLLATDKIAGKKALGNVFSKAKQGFQNLITQPIGESQLAEKLFKVSMIEGIEEVSEELASDAAKGIVDIMSACGFTKKQGSFGGFDNVFSKSGFERYVSNLVGGMVGGPMFELEHSVISPILSGHGIEQETKYNVLQLVANGQAEDLYKEIDKQKSRFGSTDLSPVTTNVDGKQIYLAKDGDSGMSQADVIANATKAYIQNADRILNLENIKEDDESVIRKAIVDDIRIADLKKNGTDSFVKSDFTQLIGDIVDLTTQLENVQTEKDDKSVNKNEVGKGDIQSKLNEKRKLVEELLKGEKAEYYHKLSLFTLNKNLHAPFISLSVDDYVKDKYDKDFYSLSESEKKTYKAEFDNIFDESKGDFKNKMKSMFDRFLEINEEFSHSIAEFNADGYANTRSSFLANFRNKGKGLSLTDAYTNWQWLQQLNTELDKNGFRTASLTSDTDIDVAHFLNDMNLIQIGLPEEQKVEIINRRDALINPKLEELNKLEEQLSTVTEPDEINTINEKIAPLQEEINTDINNADVELNQKRDINTLSTGDKEHLFAIVNSLGLPSTELDYGIIQKAFDAYNGSKNGRVKQIMGEKETISQSADLAPEDVLMQHLAKDSEITTIGNIGTIHVNGYEKKAVNKDLIKSKLLVEANKVLDELSSVTNEDGIISFSDADQILADWFDKDTDEVTHDIVTALDTYVQNKGTDVTLTEIQDVFNSTVKSKMDQISINQGNSDPKLEEVYNEALHSDDDYYTFTKGNDKISPRRSLLIKYANNVIARGEDLDNEAVKELTDAANEIRVNIQNSSLSALIPDLDNFEFDENSELGKALIDRGYKDYLNIHEILKYNKRKMNTFLDKLNEFQINLWGKTGPISFFKLLRDNYDLFDNIVAPSQFIRNNVQIDQLNKALSTITAVRSVISAMTSTEVGLGGDLYGYNVSLNMAAEKFEEVSGKFGLVDSTSAKIINDDLTFISDKLNYFKTLAERNSGSLIEEHNLIKTALVSSILKRMTDGSEISAGKLTVNGRTLINQDDLDAINKIVLAESKLAEFEHRIYTNFHNAEGNLTDKLDEVFAPFKGNDNSENIIKSIIDGKDSNLTKDLTQLEKKDWYFYLHSVLALSSKDFYLNYKKLLENEVSLSEVKAPFFVQQFVQRQEQAYFNGRLGKDIMAHSIEFVQPSIYTLKNSILADAKDADTTITEKEAYKQAIDQSRSFSIGYVFNVLGSAGTGKTTILGNFPLRMIIDSKVPSENISIHALAPTPKTLTGLKENLKNQVSVEIKEDLIKDYIKTMIGSKYDEYMEQLNLIEQDKYDDLNPEIFIKGEGDGAVAINEKWLDSVFLGHNIEGSKIVMIDEMSQLSTLEWQMFNYLAKNNNYYVIAMGDNLQNGSKIGTTSFSTQNISTPRSIKLKSTIRSKNVHHNDNCILMENFTDAIYRDSYLKEPIKYRPTLVYYDKTFLNGDKFVDNLTKADLLKLDTSKEIVFLTDSGKLSDSTQSLITSTLGIQSADIKVYSKNVQGEEFDQVVILDPIKISDSDFDTIRSLYTLVTRSKIGTLIVGSKTLLDNFGIKTEMSLSTEEKVFDNDRAKDFLTKRIDELSDMTKDYKQSDPIKHKDVKVVNEKFNTDWKETSDPEIITPISTTVQTKDPSNILGYSFFNNIGIHDISNNLDKIIGSDIDIDDLIKNSTGTDLGSILRLVNISDQSVRDVVGDYIKWKNLVLFSTIDNTIYTRPDDFRLFNNDTKQKDLVIRKLKSGEYTDPYGKLVNSNALKGKDIYVLGMNVEIGGANHFITLSALPDISNPAVKANVDFEKLSKLYDLASKGDITVDSADIKTYMGVQVPTMNDAQKDAFKKDSAITVKDLKAKFPGAFISEIKVFRGPKYDAHGVLQNGDYLKYIKKTMEEYRQTPYNTQGKNETNDEFTLRNSEEYYNRYAYRPYVTIEYVKGNIKYSKLVVLNAKSRTLSEAWTQITTADTELKADKKLKNQEHLADHETDVDAKYKKLALMSKYTGWKVFYDFLKSEQVAGKNIDTIIDDMVNHISWKNYLSKNDLESFHIVETLMDLGRFINNDASTQKTFDDLLENPKLKSIIGNRFRDVIPVKIPNPLYVIHNIMTEGKSQYEDTVTRFNSFVQTYDKPIYYNTVIDSPAVSGEFEGKLPVSTNNNYEMQYPVEPNQIMLNMDKILSKIGGNEVNTNNVKTEPTLVGVEIPNHISFDFEGNTFGVPLGNLFDKAKDVEKSKAVVSKIINGFIDQNYDDLDVENGVLKMDGLNITSALSSLFELGPDKNVQLNKNNSLIKNLVLSGLNDNNQYNCKF